MTLGLFDVAFLGSLSGGSAYDPDAQDYINRVIAADVAAGNSSGLETEVQDAINAFVVGCKADGIWNAIKASCIPAGARTLQGCLVPLVGTAPTRFGTEGGWNYNRKTGLAGGGTSAANYLDTNRNNNEDPQDNKHLSVFVTAVSGSQFWIGNNSNSGITSWIHSSGSGGINVSARINQSSSSVYSGVGQSTGLKGASRSTTASLQVRSSQTDSTFNVTSGSPISDNINVFRTALQYTNINGRISFYSIGEAIDLALLDARVTALMNALAAAIP